METDGTLGGRKFKSLFWKHKQAPDKYGQRVLVKSLPSSAMTVVIFANHEKKLDVGLKQRNDLDTWIMNFASWIIA